MRKKRIKIYVTHRGGVTRVRGSEAQKALEITDLIFCYKLRIESWKILKCGNLSFYQGLKIDKFLLLYSDQKVKSILIWLSSKICVRASDRLYRLWRWSRPACPVRWLMSGVWYLSPPCSRGQYCLKPVHMCDCTHVHMCTSTPVHMCICTPVRMYRQ